MTATLTTFKDFDVQTLEATVKGVFSGRNAFIGSVLQSSGGVKVDPSMPQHGPGWIGKNVTVPRFGVIGDFTDNAENNAAVPVPLDMTAESGTVGRGSLAFEVTNWAENSGPEGEDPYEEAARQTLLSGQRYMDKKIITAASATPLVRDVHVAGAGTPAYLDYDLMVDSLSTWGDEDTDVVGLAVTSKTKAGLRKLRDNNGRPLLIDSMKVGDVTTFCGVPVITSDRLDTTGSTMNAVVETGAAVGGVTLSGTPNKEIDLKIDIVTGGALGTATFRFSTDGGGIWSATMLTAASVPLIDSAKASLVGVNGATGLTAAFASATYNSASVYSSKSISKTTSLLIQKGALAFWYAGQHMSLKSEPDILKDNRIGAMHMYYIAHLYAQRIGGTKPGVVAVKHNVQGYIYTP